MTSIVSVQAVSKTYKSGFQALKTVDLEIRKGEIFALLGPNGARSPKPASKRARMVRSRSG